MLNVLSQQNECQLVNPSPNNCFSLSDDDERAYVLADGDILEF